MHEDVRLANQVKWLKERLRQGPVTNTELHQQGIYKYTSRISDVRKDFEPQGYRILCDYNPNTGHAVYTLVKGPAPQLSLF